MVSTDAAKSGRTPKHTMRLVPCGSLAFHCSCLGYLLFNVLYLQRSNHRRLVAQILGWVSLAHGFSHPSKPDPFLTKLF